MMLKKTRIKSLKDMTRRHQVDKQSEEKKIPTKCERKECCCVIQLPGEQSLHPWKTVMDAR